MKKLMLYAIVFLTVGAATRAERLQKTFRTTAQLVALNVTVTDGDSFVTSLAPGDFEVYEDNIRQTVEFFEVVEVPLDLILMVDTSSSMRINMPIVHDAAREFMKVLRPQDRGAVVAFNERIDIVQELTSDPAALEAAIDATSAYGSTAFNNAVYVTLKRFGRQAVQEEDIRRQAIAVLSDGHDTASVVAFQDVLALARRAAVSIYTIMLRPELLQHFSSASSAPEYTMKTLARETGGRSFFPENVHGLKHVYAAIAAELQTQYSIAYSPTNTSPDGRFRRILVRVPPFPDFRPRTRTGYTAPLQRSDPVREE